MNPFGIKASLVLTVREVGVNLSSFEGVVDAVDLFRIIQLLSNLAIQNSKGKEEEKMCPQDDPDKKTEARPDEEGASGLASGEQNPQGLEDGTPS